MRAAAYAQTQPLLCTVATATDQAFDLKSTTKNELGIKVTVFRRHIKHAFFIFFKISFVISVLLFLLLLQVARGHRLGRNSKNPEYSEII